MRHRLTSVALDPRKIETAKNGTRIRRIATDGSSSREEGNAIMEEITYKQFKREDADQVQAVALEAWSFTYTNIFDAQFVENFVRGNYSPESLITLLPAIESGQMFFHLALSGRDIIGFCNIGDRGQGIELFRLYLLPSYIGKGIGRQLLRLGEEFIISADFSKYFCFVHKDNDLGKSFYLRNGFRHITEMDQEDEWYLEKVLK